MLYQQAMSLIALVFTSSILLESCQTQTSASHRESSELAKTIQTNSSSITLRVQSSLANYKTYDDVDGLEATAELIVVGKPQASLEEIKLLLSQNPRNQKRSILLMSQLW